MTINKIILTFFIFTFNNYFAQKNLLDLPYDIINSEILKNLINNHNIKGSIKQIATLASINKSFYNWFSSYYFNNFNNNFNKSLYYTNTLLAAAIENGWYKLAEFIITNMTLSQNEKDEALLWATLNNNRFLINKLIKKGADREKILATYTTSDAQEFLNLAQKGNLVAIKRLLVQHVDIDMKDAQEETALMKASAEGHINIVKLLLKYGADINVQNDTGYTALMKAAYNGYENIVELLLQAGQDKSQINLANMHGQTALILAVIMGHCNIAKLLINYGADMNIQDCDQNTALDEAIQNGYKDIAKLLQA